MFSEKKFNQAKDELSKISKNTKVYFGVDSKRHKRNGEWFASYTGVVVLHIDGKHGCKIIHETVTERDYDSKPGRPSMRLMNEVYKVCELYLALEEFVPDQENVEIHLDINPQKEHGSSIVVSQALGYVLGMTQHDAKIKPVAVAASYAADMIEAKSCHHVAEVA